MHPAGTITFEDSLGKCENIIIKLPVKSQWRIKEDS
jgi:hypothetical protein